MTKGQIEDTLTKKAIKFYFDSLGVGPTNAKTYIIEDMIIIRMKGNLLPIEKKLLENIKGVELVKNLRRSLHESAIEEIINIVREATKQNVVSAHRDISTRTGEIIYVFILDKNYQKLLESII
ncbi:MAG: DUF2294 domain-containing protein [Patescibacteria group bacterium]